MMKILGTVLFCCLLSSSVQAATFTEQLRESVNHDDFYIEHSNGKYAQKGSKLYLEGVSEAFYDLPTSLFTFYSTYPNVLDLTSSISNVNRFQLNRDFTIIKDNKVYASDLAKNNICWKDIANINGYNSGYLFTQRLLAPDAVRDVILGDGSEVRFVKQEVYNGMVCETYVVNKKSYYGNVITHENLIEDQSYSNFYFNLFYENGRLKGFSDLITSGMYKKGKAFRSKFIEVYTLSNAADGLFEIPQEYTLTEAPDK